MSRVPRLPVHVKVLKRPMDVLAGLAEGGMQNRYYGNRGSCERVIEATDSGWSEHTVVARYG